MPLLYMCLFHKLFDELFIINELHMQFEIAGGQLISIKNEYKEYLLLPF